MSRVQRQPPLPASTPIHGVFLEVSGLGVLLAGDSGTGKSELALELIRRGHRLIADDMPEFVRGEGGVVVGRCPALLRDFLHVRDLGVLNIRRLFGDAAVGDRRRLDLIVYLAKGPVPRPGAEPALKNAPADRNVLDVIIPQIELPMYPGRNPATWVECAVRDLALRCTGYHADRDLSARLRREMKRESPCE